LDAATGASRASTYMASVTHRRRAREHRHCDKSLMAIVPPGSTIGILGGGQLGRMTAMAARTMGYHVHVLDPDADCAASAVADRVVAAKFDDADAAADLAQHCDVVTLEIEQIGVDALAAAMRYAPVRPSPNLLAVVQDRSKQKAWLRDHDFP